MMKVKQEAVKKSKFIIMISNTALQVLLAIIAGVLLGHFNPDLGVKMDIVGKSFINIIKIFIILLLCTLS